MRDAHKILSVSKHATIPDIKLAYRRLALQLHPDTNGGDAAKSEQFKRVNEAYSYLTNPKAHEEDIFDDFEQYTTSYSSRPNYTHSSNSHWNPFQSPFQNMKNAQNMNKNNKSNPFGDFDEWDDFDFIDFDTGEEISFGFNKKGKAKTSRTGKKKTNQSKEKKTHSPRDGFQEFTTDEIEDIIRNSTSPGWGSQEAHSPRQGSPKRRSNSNSNSGGGGSGGNKNSSGKGNKKGEGNRKKSGDNSGSGSGSRSTRTRRRRGDDCTIC